MPYLAVFKNIKIVVFLLIFFCYNMSFGTSFAQNNSKNSKKTKTIAKKISKNHQQKKPKNKKFIFKNPESNDNFDLQPKNTSIETDYFLEIELTQQNCDNTIVNKCFFADSLFGKPYFHPTTLHIFSNKILATQLAYHRNSIQKTYPKIINKNYDFYTTKYNKINFTAFNGNINKFFLSSTSNEIKAQPCLFADKLFVHQQIYAPTTTQDLFFKIPNNSHLKQLSFFWHNQQQYAILYNNQHSSWQTIENLILCQDKSKNQSLEILATILWQKTFHQEQCTKKLACLTQNIAEAKKECETLNNVDLEICFQQEKCQEVLEINNCQVVKNTLPTP